jgi:hypothetical protein
MIQIAAGGINGAIERTAKGTLMAANQTLENK